MRTNKQEDMITITPHPLREKMLISGSYTLENTWHWYLTRPYPTRFNIVMAYQISLNDVLNAWHTGRSQLEMEYVNLKQFSFLFHDLTQNILCPLFVQALSCILWSSGLVYIFTKGISRGNSKYQLKYTYLWDKLELGFTITIGDLHPFQQPVSYWDRSSALSLVGI